MNRNYLILLLILLFALFLRLPQILADQFIFAFDMGRDMLWVRDIVVLHKPYLIGPWGSLAGVFFGPGWYYFLTVPFLISGGDPRGSVIFVLLTNLLVIILAFVLGKKLKDERLGLIFAILIASSSLMIDLSTFAFHANLLPLTTLIFIGSLWKAWLKKDKYLLLAALMAALNFHLEPAAAIFTTLTLLTFLFLNLKIIKNKFLIFSTIFVFVLPFIPQIIFELRHQFIQTKALMAFFQGQNQSLGGVLPLGLRLVDRFNKFLDLFLGSVFSFSSKWMAILIIGFIFWVIFLDYLQNNQKIKKFIIVNLLTLSLPFIGYIFIFSPELKVWYLSGLTIPTIFLFALFLDILFKKSPVTGLTIFLILILFNSHKNQKLQDPGMLNIQKKIIDWIYDDAQGKPFRVFVYTPPVYDYHYQYLFWWYGKKKYGYWPEEYSYWPGKIDYVPYKEKYLALQHRQQPARETEVYYLIIEPDIFEERIEGWRNNFSRDKIIRVEKLDSMVKIEKREEKI